jgi:hypothetical protein
MQSYNAKQVINGSWGELWLNGDYMAEVTAFKAEVDIEYEDVNMIKELGKPKKMTGYEGKGEFKLNKVTSRMMSFMSDALQHGTQPTCTLIATLSDPDALGVEGVTIQDATLETLTLADWEAKKNGEETIPFSFTKWKPTDTIEG